MTSLRRTFVICLVLTAAFGGRALFAAAPAREDIDRLVQPYLDSDIVVGMAIGVIRGGDQLVAGYGKLSEQDERQPDGETVYEIGSASKVFTGLLLADAVARDQLQLDQEAGELLPEGISMPSHNKQPILLRHLATHSSGLPRLPVNFEITNSENPYSTYTVDHLHEFLNQHKLERAPGEKGEYSNLGMGLLGHLVALHAGESYESLLKSRIAEPLNMVDTSIDLNESQQARLAPPHSEGGLPASNWDLLALAGAGAIRSTMNDMLRFAKANLDPPVGELGEAIELAWQVHQPPLSDGDFAMGLGWHVAKDGETRWHNGQTGGYHAAIFVHRPLQVAVVLLTNTATMEVDQLAQQIVVMLAGVPVQPRSFEDALQVDAEVLQRYVGRYEVAPGFEFKVNEKDGKLLVGLTGQPMYQVFPRSETEWFYKIVEATLTFHVNDQGECEAVELFQNGVKQKAKRIE